MKTFLSLASGLRLLGLLGALLCASIARADLSYLVNINTASLIGNASGPFYLDFQSIFGSGSPQAIQVSSTGMTGGGFIGAPTSIGAVAGHPAASMIMLPSSSDPYNEFYQQFSPVTFDITFILDLTTNASGVTPTSFSVSILDNTLANIPTTGVGDSLLLFNLNGANTAYQTGTGLGVTVSLTPIPEPSTYALLAGAAMFAGIVRRRKARAA
jgi:hypothetical protein